MRLSLVFIFVSFFAFAQQNSQQLAYQYYLNGEYDKASTLYKDLFEYQFSPIYYRPYFSSLFNIGDYKEAEILAKKAVKLYPKSLSYQLEVAISQEKSGYRSKAERTYKKLFDRITGQQSQAINLANTFKRYEMYDEALQIYIASEKINPKASFRIQKAQLYSNLGKPELMINEYLNELASNHTKKKMIVGKVQKFLNNDGIKSDRNYQIVKKCLLPHVRNESDRSDFSEILIWLFMQNAQYEMALRQAKALDKRTNNNAEGVYDIGEAFLDDNRYELAVEAYEYILTKGKNNNFFVEANINKLYALTKSLNEQKKDVRILDKRYKEVISELGKNRNTVLLLSNYAHYKAFYLHDLISAEKILRDAMTIPQISDNDLAECKLEYADVMLLTGNIWESLLYYSQVEKDFKESPIGHEAKLRRAKIAYYQGDFDWAQAQLDVLKSSTSKLIANDAMDLSLLIIDNLNLDTSNIAMETFASADLLNYQQRYEDAIIKYDSVIIAFPGHSLSDEIYMNKAEIYLKLNNIDLAIEMYQSVIKEWDYDILADDAIYNLARLYDNILKDEVKALSLYEKLLIEHNSSIFVADSRRRYREIREKEL